MFVVQNDRSEHLTSITLTGPARAAAWLSRAVLLAGAAFALSVAVPVAQAQEEPPAIPNERCFGCHDDDSLVRAAQAIPAE